MNKKPILWRSIIAAVIIGVFAASMYPLTERDFFSTFTSMLKNPGDPQSRAVIKQAQDLLATDKQIEYEASALLRAANDSGTYLPDLMKQGNLENNGDAVGAVRKAAGSSIRLGLDLAGGVEFMLKLSSPDEKPVEGETPEQAKQREERYARQVANLERDRDQIIEIMRSRLEEQGINECEISPTGDWLISLRAPVVSREEKQKLEQLVCMSARLRFHLVHENNEKMVREYLALTPEERRKFIPPPGYELKETVEFSGKDKSSRQATHHYYFINKRWEMDGQNIDRATPQQDPTTMKREIGLAFNSEGTKQFANVTRANVGRQLAIVLDGKLYCAPVIKTAIENGNAVINGDFSQDEIKRISDALNSGSIPFVITREAMFDMDPTLGRDNVRNGMVAGGIALVLVALFIGIYYRRAGVVAVISLAVNLVLILGALAAFSATLTLPGIAGIILTIGMAVDANVLIFERIREELSLEKPLGEAISLGFQKASSAVLDSNITTLFTGIILYSVGTGAIKGFAVTLCVGIITSVFCALFLSRLIFDIIDRIWHPKTMKMFCILRKPNFKFMKHRRAFYIFSGTLIAISLVTMAIKGGEMFSIDFTGGNQISFYYSERIPPANIENTLKTMGYADSKISYKSGSEGELLELLIRGDASAEANTETAKTRIGRELNKLFPTAKLTGGDDNAVGGLVGNTFRNSALLALALSFIMVVIYITFRYEFGYGLAAILALVHDVIISVGVFLLCSREISLSVVAAILTIIGYSLNDTIVVFDRIRELLTLEPDKDYAEVVDTSLNQTLSRTLLTSMTTLLVIVILFLFGGISINDFVLVMMVGVLIGTYSSICIASPIVAKWHKRNDKQRRNAAVLKRTN
ncbi:MAG: protein translocase subunit SecD [Victivallaceae bacterium]